MSHIAIHQKSKSKMEIFRLNQTYYEKNKDELLKKYRHKFVAIWDESIIDSDEDNIRLAKRVYTKIGYLPIYIQKVEKERQQARFP